MWLRYYVSVLNIAPHKPSHTDIQGLANMMSISARCSSGIPEFADAYDLLAVARNAGGGPAAALQAERPAIGLSPRDDRYVYHLAQINVADKKWDAADVLLERLKASGNPQIAGLARDLIEQAGAQRKYGIAGSTPAQPKFAPAEVALRRA